MRQVAFVSELHTVETRTLIIKVREVTEATGGNILCKSYPSWSTDRRLLSIYGCMIPTSRLMHGMETNSKGPEIQYVSQAEL
jgi:hypothetical protein